MGTPWSDRPPLVYFAEPIDKASGQNFAVASTMVSTLSTWGCNIYRPSRAFTATRLDPRIEQINRHALRQADVIVAYLSETTPSIGVPAEIEAATNHGIPAVVHYTGKSFALAGNPRVTVIDDASSVIQVVEHAIKKHPRQTGITTTIPNQRITIDPELLGDQPVDIGAIYNEIIAAPMSTLLEDEDGAPLPPAVQEAHQQSIYDAMIAAYKKMERRWEPPPDHHRVNGWCLSCGGSGDPDLQHLDVYVNGPAEPLRLVITDGATPPSRAYPDDAGIDLTTAREHTIEPGDYVDIHTQVEATQLPPGFWGLITGRSSALRKWRLHIPPAIIDPGWRGPLFVGAWNLSANPVTVRPGDRLGQLILIPNHTPPVSIVDTVEDHPRGLKGFGSTG